MKEENIYDEYLKDELKKYKDVKTIVFNKPKQEILLEDVFNEEKNKGVKELIDKHTLEEASWKHNPLKKLDGEFIRHAFKEGAKWQQEQNDTSKVTRVEVIQHSPPYNGRAYTNYNAKDVEIQLQDDGKTLKIFLK